jgi:hypothetical protein
MKKLGYLLILLAYSCIPLKIAPNIEAEKIVNAKNLKMTFQIFTVSSLMTPRMLMSFTILLILSII